MLAETLEYQDHKINVFYEELMDLFHPRETQENLGIMACFHGRYRVGDQYVRENFPSADDFNDWYWRKKHTLISLPVYMYDHSGICLNTVGFSCPWDSGQIGYIYVSRDEVRKVFDWKRLSPQRLARIRGILKAEVAEYSDYLAGNVFYYQILSPDGEALDTCSGFIGDNDCSGLLESAHNYIDHLTGRMPI